MDELAAGLAEYMDEEAAKGSGEKVEPNATEEATSAPCAAPTDAIEASPPPPRAQLVRHLLFPQWINQRK